MFLFLFFGIKSAHCNCYTECVVALSAEENGYKRINAYGVIVIYNVIVGNKVHWTTESHLAWSVQCDVYFMHAVCYLHLRKSTNNRGKKNSIPNTKRQWNGHKIVKICFNSLLMSWMDNKQRNHVLKRPNIVFFFSQLYLRQMQKVRA